MNRPKGLPLLGVLLLLFWAWPARGEMVYRTYLLPEKAPIRVDGDLSDWEGLGLQTKPISNVVLTSDIPYPPSNRADLSGEFMVVADRDNFWVAVSVRDDKRIWGEEKYGSAHEDDAVEVYFDGDLASHTYKKGSCDYDANDAEIRFSKGRDGKIVLEGMGLFGGRLFMFPGLWESLGIMAAIKENPKGYTAELQVPKGVFVPFPLRVGSQIGFNVMVNDDDDGGRRDSKISWTADLKDESWQTTRYFGRLLIGERRIEKIMGENAE